MEKTLINNLQEFEMYLRERRLSDASIKTYIGAVKHFYKTSGGKEPDAGNVAGYVERLMADYSPSTVNLYSIAFNAYLRYLGLPNLCIRTRRLAVKRSLENVITIEEYETLLRYAKETKNYKYYYLFKVLAYTGIRIGELQYVTVENVRQGHAVIRCKGRCREIFIAEHLQSELMKYCAAKGITKGAIFTGYSGKPISRGAVWQMMYKMADATGIPKDKVHPHSFRHMMAIQYMDKYKNISELADILGHSSIEITRIYTVTTKEEKRKKLDGLYV